MKKFLTSVLPIIIIAAMFITIIPIVSERVSNEKNNDKIVISLLYNDIANKVSEKKLDEILTRSKDTGVNVVSVMEDDVNSLVARGEITCIKYNVLLHKYDDESIRIASQIAERYPDISFDSFVVITKRDEGKEKMRSLVSGKYDENTVVSIPNVEGVDIYIFLDGREDLWNFSLGYDEKDIIEIKSFGYDVALIYKVKNYASTEYLAEIERLVKQYDIKYLNIKCDPAFSFNREDNKKNYTEIARIINDNDMTLVVTENVDQLSNQMGYGYNEIFTSVMGEGGSRKVMRSFETYDDSQSKNDPTMYKYRVAQYFNSTLDRNIRFVTVTQIAVEKNTFEECADLTLKAVEEYKNKIEKEGFTVSTENTAYDYSVNKRVSASACSVIIIMMLLLALKMITENALPKLTSAAIIISILGFIGSYFVIPDSLLSLYPSLFCVASSCFAMTAVMYFIKKCKEKLPVIPLTICSIAVILACLMIGALGMGALLSGTGYHFNNEIFRGIKLSLIVPIFYTTIVYYFMFIKKSNGSVIDDIRKLLFLDIKVYWVLIGGIVLAVGAYYILRSGNVNSISSAEAWMRNTLTELFSARPRTKEFLIGYPCLVLFAYYSKKYDIKLISWLLAIASSILAASVTNSFCHVFTDLSTIYMRTVNGLIVGIAVSVFAYVANLLLVAIVKAVYNKYSEKAE